ncbi:PAS domain S-box protein [Prosthecobacter sp.]|uniref:PAS domain S-box protein n=1 Tax=Prosthecobacter sp. TaxID=1965333 RepID=UPI0025D95ACB|nr:PAS domain S-box protein [Prosthecobacter sp.]
MFLTCLVTYSANHLSHAREQSRFDHAVEQTHDDIEQRMRQYITLLEGLRGLVNAKVSMQREQFHAYVGTLRLSHNYPGLQGLGFGVRVPPEKKAELIQVAQGRGEASFHIWPDSQQRKVCSVIHLAPMDSWNSAMIGFDMLSEPVRRAAIDRAIESGEPAVSGRVARMPEIQAEEQRFVIYCPVYMTRDIPGTREARQAQALGCVFCPFNTDVFFKAFPSRQNDSRITIRIYDTNGLNDPAELNDSHLLYDGGHEYSGNQSQPEFTTLRPLFIADSIWSLEISTRPQFAVDATTNLAPFTLVGGVAMSFLLFGITLTQSRSRAAADLFAAELQAHEAEFRAAFYSDGVGNAQVDSATGRYLRVNQRFCEITGYSEKELVQMAFTDLVHPEDLASDQVAHQRLIGGEIKDLSREKRYVRKDGRIVWVNINAALIDIPDGQPLRTLVVIQDITERRHAEQALVESEELFRKVFEEGPVGIAMASLDNGRVTAANSALCAMLGYTEEEMQSLTFRDVTHPDDLAVDEQAVRQLSAGQIQRHHTEKRYLRKNGEVIWGVRALTRVRSAGSEIYYALAMIQDVTERKLGEAALKESEEKFSKLFRNSPDAILLTTLDGRILDANAGFTRLTGFTTDEAIDHTTVDIHFWAELADRERFITTLRTHRRVLDLEATICTQTGEKRECLVSGELMELRGQTVIVGSVRDITERKRTEAALQDREERFRTMANSIPQLAWIAQADGHISWYNQRWYEYTGTTPEQMEGWGWQEVHDPEVLPKVMEEWKAVLAAEQPFEMEFPLRGADGRFRSFLTRVQPLKDASGRLIQWFGTNTDVDAMKQAEAEIHQLNAELEQRVVARTTDLEAANRELRESRAELESLFESLPGLYLVLTPDFKIVAASDAYLTATMTTREGIVDRGLFEVFPDNPDDPQADGVSNLRASLNRVLANGEADTMAIQKYDVRGPDGAFEERYWSPINSPLIGADRKIQYIIHRVEEVTEFVLRRSQTSSDAELSARMEQMEAEIFSSSQKVQAVNIQLEAANKELESFSYSVSHDLRAPLRAMDGFSRAVLEDYGSQLPPDGLRYLQVIRTSAQRMGNLIDDLLSFSRLSRAAMSKRTIDVRRLVQDAMEELQSQSEGRQIDLRIGDLPTCEGDPTLLKQVWINLLSNAFKYTQKRESAVIEIGCNPDGGRNVYHVRDNGTGFDMRYAHKLFGVFQRLHRAEDYDGTGVGLAIVQRIIHRHGGRVWAEAAVDQGATFYFTLEGDNPP